MKHINKLLVLLISTSLVFTSMGIGVFAEDDSAESKTASGTDIVNTGNVDVQTGDDKDEPAASDGAEEPSTEDADRQVFETPAEMNVSISSTASDGRVTISWNVVADATGYVVTVKEGAEVVYSSGDEFITETSLEYLPEEGHDKLTVEVSAVKDSADNVIAAGSCEITAAKLKAPTGLTAIRGYNNVKLRWNKVPGATGYKVYIAKNTGSEQKRPSNPITYDSNETDTSCTLKDLTRGEYYRVWVVPYRTASDKSTYGDAATKVTAKVHTLYYTATLREKVTLYCHCGGHRGKAKTLKSGYKVHAYGYTSGKYVFKSGGHTYHVSSLRCRSAKAITDHGNAYTEEEAEYFISQLTKNKKSKTGYIIWASLYTQNVYIFKWSDGKYKVIRSFVCGSGKPATPSPTGKNKSIWYKMRSYHGRSYWSCYSSYNSFHGLKKEKLKGKTMSHGCIRVNDKDAKYIYSNIPKNTRVIVM